MPHSLTFLVRPLPFIPLWVSVERFGDNFIVATQKRARKVHFDEYGLYGFCFLSHVSNHFNAIHSVFGTKDDAKVNSK